MWRRMRATFAALVAASTLGCFGPLDRRDGRLSIELVNIPHETKTIAATVYAGGRRFDHQTPPPIGDKIDAFSAIPIGHASIEVKLLALNGDVVGARTLTTDIVADQTSEVSANF